MTLIKRIAAILLMVCFVLPLSRCTTTVESHGKVTASDTHLYGYEMAREALSDMKANNSKGVLMMLAVLTVFFMPAICLAMSDKLQAALLFPSSFGALYALSWWVLVFGNHPEIGGVIAMACWVILFFISGMTLFTHLRSSSWFTRHCLIRKASR